MHKVFYMSKRQAAFLLMYFTQFYLYFYFNIIAKAENLWKQIDMERGEIYNI